MNFLNLLMQKHRTVNFNKLNFARYTKFADSNFLYFLHFIEFVYFITKISINKNYAQTNSLFLSVFLVKITTTYFKKPFLNLQNNLIRSFNEKVILLLINVRWIFLAGIIAIIYFFLSIFYIQIDFTKQLATWYIVFITYYLLMSCFNSFLVKYRYGKFTSAIQRFWKRTGMIFWLIEGFLFLLFFYYFLNSSQEPLYMFDYASLNQELVIQLKNSYKNMILLSLAIYLSFILLLKINFLFFYQSVLILLLISLIIFYTLYIESYQFVYIINLFVDKEWVFDETEQLWVLEAEENNLRVKQQYFILCLIAKYWHFIFIFISWFFFIIKSLEASKISITMLGYNTQNLLILYVLNLMCLIQWFKIIFKKLFDVVYYWFFIQYDEKFIVNFFTEFFNIIYNCVSLNFNILHFDIINISSTLYMSNELTLWKYIN